MARVSWHRSQSGKHPRVYWVHRRTADVHSVGEVVVLFSNQKGPQATAEGAVRVQKVLMSDALRASTEELLGWYALRWQVEEYHRGIKQFCGVERCQVRRARAQRNHIGMSLRAFLRMECHCLVAPQRTVKGSKERPIVYPQG